jgi:hypothetical protein
LESCFVFILKTSLLRLPCLCGQSEISQGSAGVSDEEPRGGPLPFGCAVAGIAWFVLLFGCLAFGFREGALCLILSPVALLALAVLVGLLSGIKRAWVEHRPQEWGRFLLIAAGLSWIWYIPLTFVAIRTPPGEALASERPVIECLGVAAGQSFLYHALPMIPLLMIAQLTIGKFYRPYYVSERNDSLVYSAFLAFFVWSNPFVYSHYYVLRVLTSYPKVWLVVIQLLLACACGFSIGYLPAYLRYRHYKRAARS